MVRNEGFESNWDDLMVWTERERKQNPESWRWENGRLGMGAVLACIWSWSSGLLLFSSQIKHIRFPWDSVLMNSTHLLKAYCIGVQAVLWREVCVGCLHLIEDKSAWFCIQTALYPPTSTANFNRIVKENLNIYPQLQLPFSLASIPTSLLAILLLLW